MYTKTGNPFEFMKSLNSVYGAQRSNSFVLLPQVFYRYFLKILPSIGYAYFPQVFSTYLEIVTGILFFGLAIVSYFKLRLSYSLYLTVGYLIPTLSGSFSSFPRYALVLFPGFILLSLYAAKLGYIARVCLYILSSILLFVATALFIRGYWIS